DGSVDDNARREARSPRRCRGRRGRAATGGEQEDRDSSTAARTGLTPPWIRTTPTATRARLAKRMIESGPYVVHPIGVVRSPPRAVADAPNQASEGAPAALLEIDPSFADALHRIEPGDELILLTWLHLADREVRQTHPTGDERIPLTGVFG